jgi:hypothetical protein
MKRNVRILGMALTLGAGLLATNTTPAALIQFFRFEEGAIDPTTNAVYSSASTNSALLVSGTSSMPIWVTTNQPPSPAPGSSAALFFDGTQTTKASVQTDFAGSDGVVLVTGKVARTVCAWIKSELTNQPAANGAHIVSWGGGSGGGITGGRYTVKLNPNSSGSDAGKLRLEVQGGGINGTKDLRDGKWHHIAIVNTNNSTVGNATLYLDGAVEPITTSSGTTTAINTVVNTTGVDWVRIGGGNWDGSRGFNGAIDDVRIYDTALTLTDIQVIVFGGVNPPVVNQPVANQSIVLGDTNATALFSVAAGGTPPLSYQWKFYGTNLPGQTNASLAISSATPANAGPYQVVITNMFGSTNSSASLALATAPVDPPQQVTLVGSNATFRVSMPATSSGYTYQWNRNGTNVAGATAATFTVGSATLSDDSSNYTVAVTLSGNTATSSPAAKLKVLPVPASSYAKTVLGDGPEAYWRLGETNGASVAVDQTSFHPGSFDGFTGVELGATGALTNEADTASSFSPGTGNYIETPYSTGLNSSNAMTLEAWVFPNSTGVKQTIIASSGGLPNSGYELFISAAGDWTWRTSTNQNSAGPAWLDLDGGPASVGAWSHVVATFDGTTGVKRIYVNGAVIASQVRGMRPVSGIPLRIGCGVPSSTPAEFVDGVVDEVAIYRKVLSYSQVGNHYAVGSGLLAPPLPFLTLTTSSTDLTLSWPGSNWVLQSKPVMDGSPAGWTDVTTTSPYVIPTPVADQQYFRLRGP